MTSEVVVEPTNAKSKRGFLGIAMAILAPLALFGLVALPNEYQAMGIVGAVDCDGPLSVFMFSFPALAAYIPGFGFFAYSAFTTRRIGVTCVALFAGLVCFGLVANTAFAAKELLRAEHKESCGVST